MGLFIFHKTPALRMFLVHIQAYLHFNCKQPCAAMIWLWYEDQKVL